VNVLNRGAEFLNPSRQAELVEAAARRRVQARGDGTDFDDLPRPAQDEHLEGARAVLDRHASTVPGHYIAHVGERNGGDHFVNVEIDSTGRWTTYDAQMGARTPGHPAGVQRIWKVSPVVESAGPVPATVGRPNERTPAARPPRMGGAPESEPA